MEIPEGYGQVNFKFTGINVPTGAEIVMGFNLGGSVDDPATIAENFGEDWETATIANLYTNEVSLSSILVKFGPNATGPSAEVPYVVLGAVSGDCVPPGSCGLINKNTNFGGRAGKGRVYLPGVPYAVTGFDGSVNSTWTGNATTYFEAFRTAVEARDYYFALLHGAGSPLSSPSRITGFSAQSRLATQRRRLRR